MASLFSAVGIRNTGARELKVNRSLKVSIPAALSMLLHYARSATSRNPQTVEDSF